jgi:hypothetical protein
LGSRLEGMEVCIFKARCLFNLIGIAMPSRQSHGDSRRSALDSEDGMKTVRVGSVSGSDYSTDRHKNCPRPLNRAKIIRIDAGFNERRSKSDTAADIEEDRVDGWMILGSPSCACGRLSG